MNNKATSSLKLLKSNKVWPKSSIQKALLKKMPRKTAASSESSERPVVMGFAGPQMVRHSKNDGPLQFIHIFIQNFIPWWLFNSRNHFPHTSRAPNFCLFLLHISAPSLANKLPQDLEGHPEQKNDAAWRVVVNRGNQRKSAGPTCTSRSAHN